MNLDDYPQVNTGAGHNQMISTTGHTRLMNFRKVGDPNITPEEFTAIVNELTGDWVKKITCEEIYDAEGKNNIGLVYFGSDFSLKEDMSMDGLNHASKFERYRFMPDHIPFVYTDDPECAKKFEFEPDKRSLALFTDKNNIPYKMIESKTQSMEQSDIVKFVLNGMSK